MYLDDLIIHAQSFEEELARLESIFIRLRDAGLKLSPQKCHVFQEEVSYLGQVVSRRVKQLTPRR